MIHVDISDIWGELSLPDLLACEQEVLQAHDLLMSGKGPGGDRMGWMKVPVTDENQEIRSIRAAAKRIREGSDALVVLGINGGCMGAQAAIELLRGRNHNLNEEDPQIFFAGNSLSTNAWNDLCRQLEGKDFSVNIVSQSGTTVEVAIAVRALRWMLERKYGAEKAKHRIFVTTAAGDCPLRQMAQDEGYTCFTIPADVTGPFSVLTAAGLLPMAVAGIEPMDLMRGAAVAKRELSFRGFDNPVWLYAAARNLLCRRGKGVELLAGFEPDLQAFGAWWQQLLARAEGKNGQGIVPIPVEYPAGIYGLGQLIGKGQRNLFQTMLRFDPPRMKTGIELDWKNLDGLNYLEGKTLDYVQQQAAFAALAAHVDGNVPVLAMDAGPISGHTLGELFWFFQMSACVSAYIAGVDPTDRSGVDVYEQNLYQLLGKPGY